MAVDVVVAVVTVAGFIAVSVWSQVRSAQQLQFKQQQAQFWTKVLSEGGRTRD